MKLFKILFLLLFLGFGAKTMRLQAPDVYTANWCISFSNPDYVPTVNDMSFIAQPSSWIAMGKWRMIPGTGISYSPNLNSMRMWADTLCSIINRKCRPAYYITPATLSAYIQADCIIKDMSEGGISYRNYNAQLKTGVFGYKENEYFAKGTKGIADKNSGICFCKVSNKACGNPNDPNLPEVKSYVPAPVPVPQPAPAAVVQPAPAPAPALAAAPEIPPFDGESTPAAAAPQSTQGGGNTYNTYNYYYGYQPDDNNVIYAEPQYDYIHTTSYYETDYGPYTTYYRSYRQNPEIRFDVNINNRREVQPNNQPPVTRRPDPRSTPGGPGGAPGHSTPNSGGPGGAPGSNGPIGARGHRTR